LRRRRFYRASPLLDEFGRLTLRPGIVGQAELDPIGNGWMVIVQKHSDWIRLRVGQIYLAQNLKRLCACLTGVRRESVRDLQSIRSGGMFSPARCTIASRLAVSGASFFASGSNL